MPKQKTTKVQDAQTPSQADAGTDAVPSIAFLFDWNTEITRFYMSRFQQIGLLPWRFQSCRSQDDVNALQAEFQRKLVDDYRRQAGRLLQIVGAPGHSEEAGEDADYAASLLKAQEDAATIIEEAKAQAESIVTEARERAKEFEEAPEKVAKKTA